MVKQVSAHENSKANQIAAAQKNKNEDQQLYPDVTWPDNWHYKIGHESIRTHYFGPAHTNGDAVIHFEHANIAHVGDLMFNRIYPFIDKSAGASATNWMEVLTKIMQTFDGETVFVFGHGKDIDHVTGTKQDLKAMRNYFEAMFDFVGKQMKAGKTKDDIIKATEIPNVGDWKDDFKICGTNLGIAYDELSAKQ